jgi:hypothetical protein
MRVGPPRTLLRRFPFLSGLAAGALAMLSVLGLLAAAGAVDTDDLYPPISGVVQVWDRHGSSDPSDWELLGPGHHRLADASDVYIETEAVRIRGAAAAGAPFTFAVQPRVLPAGRAPLAPTAGAVRTGPVAVDVDGTAAVTVTMRSHGVTARLYTEQSWHGYELRTEPAQRVEVATRRGAWALQDEVEPLAAGTPREGGGRFRLSPGRAYALSLEGRASAVVVAARPGQWLAVPATGPVVLGAGGDGAARVYVGAMADAARFAGPAGRRLVLAPPVRGRVLASFLDRRGLSSRLIVHRVVTVAPVPAGTRLAVAQRMSGADEPENLRGEALSAFARP